MINNWINQLIQNDVEKAKIYTASDTTGDNYLTLLVAQNLACLIDPKKNGPLLKRIQHIRCLMLLEMDINIKGVRVCDAEIPDNSYSILFANETLVEGVIEPDYVLVPCELLEKNTINYKKISAPFSDKPLYWVPNSELKHRKYRVRILVLSLI